MTRTVRFTSAEIARAKEAAEAAGLRLVGLEKRPDGTLKFEFGDDSVMGDDWRRDSPLYREARQ